MGPINYFFLFSFQLYSIFSDNNYKVRILLILLTDDLPERRKKHPYVMYDMLNEIPKGIKKTIEVSEEFEIAQKKGNFYFTGNGTSFHSTIAGAQVCWNNEERIKFVQSYELENFWNPTGTIIAYSHTGKTRSTVDAVKKHTEGNHTIGVSHYGNSPLLQTTKESLVIGDSPDRSLCNTKAFFDNAFNSMIFTSKILNRSVEWNHIADFLVSSMPIMERQAKEIASEIHDVNNVYFLGAGPDLVFAREGAQKMREATHLRAEGIELEEFNHGCTAVIDQNTLIIAASNSVVEKRVSEIVRASAEVGTRTLVLNGSGYFAMFYDTPDEINIKPIFNILASYYLSYYMALALKVNPDLLRFEDRKYLKYDSIVFPPGAH